MSDWIRVKRPEICPICEKSDGCSISADGTAVCCSRVPSDKLVGAPFAGGYIHKLEDPIPKRRLHRKPKKHVPEKNFFELCRLYQRKILSGHFAKLSQQLGISVASLKRLQTGWDGSNYTFPMASGTNRIRGISLRTIAGKKFMVTGSKLGLYWPVGVSQDSKEILFICEGASDCGALLDLGFEPIARVSCNSCVDYIVLFLKGHNRKVIIMTDKDTPKTRPDGSTWRPGQEGAYALVEAIKPLVQWVKVVRPREKDMRKWLNRGATKKAVLAVADNTRFL